MTLIDRMTGTVGVSRVSIQLKLKGFQPVAQHLLGTEDARTQPLSSHTEAQCQHRLHQSMGSAWMPWSTCLTRAIWLSRRLRSDGIDACIKLGVHATTGTASAFRAHAWVQAGSLRLDQDESLLERLITLKPTQSSGTEKTP